ncbi:YbaB/EbfC family nucleoid-associated protein [Nonomuraea basaltis]|uniref:YbaB/EbfC family nucleoid-associated protein n=1 Tax=Nonomuraea basaltis TaxID=2495887 RepID=UPI00110C5088|nr:YbaB/EbfC family nucleoid-associated protein [Nonomuraea basaltis]TMR96076.1 YbaB/EbfC family DNA-binding protein [Nonomuraea basaltis]
MQEFGDFAKIDLEKLMSGMDKQFALMEEFQENLGTCVGRAQDEDGYVTVECGQEGVQELELHPKAMRLSSGELAELIKTVLHDAMADFQAKMFEAAGDVFGEEDNPLAIMKDPQPAIDKMKRADAMHDRAHQDVMGQLDQIRRRMEL